MSEEVTVTEESTVLPAEAGAEEATAVENLDQEGQLKAVLDELESLREENAKLKQNNTELETVKTTQFDRMKELLMGRVTSTDDQKVLETPSTSAPTPPQLADDYYTRPLDL